MKKVFKWIGKRIVSPINTVVCGLSTFFSWLAAIVVHCFDYRLHCFDGRRYEYIGDV